MKTSVPPAVFAAIVAALAVAFAGGGFAQANPASAAEESFRVLPKTVKPESQNVQIRLEAKSADLFASDSARTPRLSFSTGITLVTNSFSLLSPSEATATINVAKEAAGIAEVRLTFYSTDGRSAVRQERGTLGIGNDKEVSLLTSPQTGSSAGSVKLRTSDVKLVQVNVDETQVLGDIILDGNAAGEIVINPPQGTLFVQGQVPTVKIEVPQGTAQVNQAKLDPGLGTFRFTIVNGAFVKVVVTVSNLGVDTSNYGRLGGALGVLSSSVSGLSAGPGMGVISSASLVSNGHTALEKLEGRAITDTGLTPDAAPTPNPGTTPTPTNPGTVSTPNYGPSGSNTNRNSDAERARREAEREAERRRRDQASRAQQGGVSMPGQVNSSSNFGPRTMPANRWQSDNRSNVAPPTVTGTTVPPGATASGGSIGSSGGRTGGGIGRMTSGPASTSYDREAAKPTSVPTEEAGVPAEDPQHEPDYRALAPRKLEVSQRLYFADKDWNAVSGVVLQPNQAGNQETRVWVVLERNSDLTDEIDTVTITLRFGRMSREVKLTETGATTGVFRCDPAGIEVTAIGVAGDIK